MAPTKQPQSLQNLCLENGSELILDYAFVYQNHTVDPYNKGFQGLADFIEKHVPNLLRCNLFHNLIKKMSLCKSDSIHSEVIVFLMKVLISSEVQQLSFSDLIYAGGVSYDLLDSFENGIGEVFPYLPRLTYLDLSTHKSEVSLPSCSYKLLYSVGQNCPNLRILNLNNNNRVTDDCLRCLAPWRYHQGCPFLEEIYIQECSVTDKTVVWLLKTFHCLQKIGHSDMGSILKKYVKTFRKYPHRRWPKLNLTYLDNTESTYIRSDRRIISLISDVCPYAENIRVRVCDEDCLELYKLHSLMKLELHFYTGIHHVIGNVTLNYLRTKGHFLTSLTIFCNELQSHHVVAITTTCYSLMRLFLHCNTFNLTHYFQASDNMLNILKVLTIRVGQHEMDESQSAGSLVRFLMEGSIRLEEVFLLLVCRNVNSSFFHRLLSINNLSKLQTFIYDAPRRNGELPVIPLRSDTAFMMIEICPSLITIGNLISWEVTSADVCHLKDLVRKRNYEVNVIYSLHNKMNTKYF